MFLAPRTTFSSKLIEAEVESTEDSFELVPAQPEQPLTQSLFNKDTPFNEDDQLNNFHTIVKEQSEAASIEDSQLLHFHTTAKEQ